MDVRTKTGYNNNQDKQHRLLW